MVSEREVLDQPADVRGLLRGPVRPWLGAIAGYVRAGQASGRHHPEINAELYVVHVLLMVLTAVASFGVAGATVGGEGRGELRDRYGRELARIARVSLFAPATVERPSRTLATARRRKTPAS